MSKVAIVFWSATGNTETMANCIAEGAGANGTIVPCTEMTPAKLAEFDVVAFGCPASVCNWGIIPCAVAHRGSGQGGLSRRSHCFLCRRTKLSLVC